MKTWRGGSSNGARFFEAPLPSGFHRTRRSFVTTAATESIARSGEGRALGAELGSGPPLGSPLGELDGTASGDAAATEADGLAGDGGLVGWLLQPAIAIRSRAVAPAVMRFISSPGSRATARGCCMVTTPIVGSRSPDDRCGARPAPSTFVESAGRRTGRIEQGGRLLIGADRVRTVMSAPLVDPLVSTTELSPMEAIRPRSFDSPPSFEAAPARVAPRLTPDGLAAFRASLSGTVVLPDDPDFDTVRHVHNSR